MNLSFIKNGINALVLALVALFAIAISFSLHNNLYQILYLFGLIVFIPAFIYLLIFQHRYYIALFAFLIPMSVSYDFSGNVASLPSELILPIMALLYVLRIVFTGLPEKKYLKHPLSILILIDLLWTFVASIMSSQPEVSFKRLTMKAMFVLVFYFAWGPFFSKAKNIRLFFLAYALGMVLPIINTLINHSVHYFVMRAAFFVTEPFYPEHTIYAACLSFVLVVLLALFLEKRSPVSMSNKYMVLILILLLSVADYFAFSRAAWLSLLAGFCFYTVLKFNIPKYILIGSTLLLLIILSTNFNLVLDRFERNTAVSSSEDVSEHVQSLTSISSDASNAERLNRWVSAWEMFKARPIFGFGPGTYQFQYGVFQKPEYLTRISTFEGDKGNAHSEYLNVLSEAGIGGLILLLLIIWQVFQTGFVVYRKSTNDESKYYVLALLVALVTYYTHGIVNCFIDVDKASVLVYAGLAIVVQLHLRQRSESIKDLEY